MKDRHNAGSAHTRRAWTRLGIRAMRPRHAESIPCPMGDPAAQMRPRRTRSRSSRRASRSLSFCRIAVVRERADLPDHKLFSGLAQFPYRVALVASFLVRRNEAAPQLVAPPCVIAPSISDKRGSDNSISLLIPWYSDEAPRAVRGENRDGSDRALDRPPWRRSSMIATKSPAAIHHAHWPIPTAAAAALPLPEA